MKEKPKRVSPARKMALGAVMAAAGTALMLLGGVIPVFTYVSPLLASLFLIPVEHAAGRKAAAAVWVITSVLTLLLGADKEAAFFYVFFGWYPLMKPVLDRIGGRRLRLLIKFLLFCFCSAVLIGVTVLLLGIGESLTETPGLHWADLAFLFGVAVCMLLFDKALEKLTPRLHALTEKILH